MGPSLSQTSYKVLLYVHSASIVVDNSILKGINILPWGTTPAFSVFASFLNGSFKKFKKSEFKLNLRVVSPESFQERLLLILKCFFHSVLF